MFDIIQVQTYAPADGHSSALAKGQRKACFLHASYILCLKK